MKILFVLLFCFTSIFACLCSAEIIQAFSQLQSKVVSSLTSQKSSLSNLKPKIEDSIDLLKNQNLNLEKLNTATKHLSIKKENLIFLLNQKIELEK